jgi:hypothetical protein
MICVRDVAGALRFYQDLIGLRTTDVMPARFCIPVWFVFGFCTVTIAYRNYNHRLQAEEVEITQLPKPMPLSGRLRPKRR